jgi:hypothetical protein
MSYWCLIQCPTKKHLTASMCPIYHSYWSEEIIHMFSIGVKKTGSSTQTNNATMGKSLGLGSLPMRMAFQSQICKSRPSCLLQSRHGTNFTAYDLTPPHGQRRPQRPPPTSCTLWRQALTNFIFVMETGRSNSLWSSSTPIGARMRENQGTSLIRLTSYYLLAFEIPPSRC